MSDEPPTGVILVIGATGTTGRPLVSALRAAGATVRAASLDGRALGDVPGVRFDWNDPDTHAPALAGVRSAYLLPPPGEHPERVMLPFLSEASELGLERVVLLSNSATPSGGPGVGLVHQRIPEMFAEWAVLRPTWFMQDFVGRHPWAQMIARTSTIVGSAGDARVGFIDADDIGHAGAAALLDAAAPNDECLLTGPQALGFADVASVLSTTAAGQVTYVQVPGDELVDRYAQIGVADGSARFVAVMDSIIASGSEDRVTSAVDQLTGRPPRAFAQFAVAAYGPGPGQNT